MLGILAQRDLRDPLTRLRRPAPHTPDGWVEGDRLVLPLDERSPTHHVVVAGSGAGKTTLLRRMTAAHLAAGWRVLVLDLKGDEADRAAWLSAASGYQTRAWPGESVDLFRGSGDKIAARIERLMPSDGPGYYRARLTLALHYLIAQGQGEPPRSTADVLLRFSKPAMFADQAGLAQLTTKSGGRTLVEDVAAEVAAVLAPLDRPALGMGVSRGWGLDDPQSWDFGLVAADAADPNQLRVAVALLADLDDWRTGSRRQVDPRPLLLVIDEAGALGTIGGAPSLPTLMRQARSARVSVVVAAQDVPGLGDDWEAVLDAGGAALWLGRTPSPEEMVKRAGTRRVVEVGHQAVDGLATGTTTLREQQSYLVDPESVRRWPAHRWAVAINGRCVQFVVPTSW